MLPLLLKSNQKSTLSAYRGDRSWIRVLQFVGVLGLCEGLTDAQKGVDIMSIFKHKYIVTDRSVWRSEIKKLTVSQAEELRNLGYWVEPV